MRNKIQHTDNIFIILKTYLQLCKSISPLKISPISIFSFSSSLYYSNWGFPPFTWTNWCLGFSNLLPLCCHQSDLPKTDLHHWFSICGLQILRGVSKNLSESLQGQNYFQNSRHYYPSSLCSHLYWWY